MIRDIRRKYFEVWGEEQSQNLFLKYILLVLGSLFAVQSIILLILALKAPVLVGIGEQKSAVLQIVAPSEKLLEIELDRLLRKYAQVHYNWDSSNIETSFNEAAKYVSTPFRKAFTTANAEQIRLAKEKRLTQKVYIDNTQVDAKSMTARITMDRILLIDGLRATNPIVLEVTYESGPRTETNPEGIYITGEKLIASN